MSDQMKVEERFHRVNSNLMEITVTIDAARLAAHDVDPLSVQRALARTNERTTLAGPTSGGTTAILEAGHQLASVDDVTNVVVHSAGGRALRVGDVAEVTDADAEERSFVLFL